MHVLCKDSWKSRHSLGATAATRPRTNNWKDSETLIYKLKLFLSSTSQFSAFLSKAVSVRFTRTRPLKCKMKNLDKKTWGPRIAKRRFLSGLPRDYFFWREGAAIHTQATIKPCRQPLHVTEPHVSLKHKLIQNIVPFWKTFVTKKKSTIFK